MPDSSQLGIRPPEPPSVTSMSENKDISTLQVPVVDIAKLVALKDDADLNAALRDPEGPLLEIIESIRAAASEWGFFYISNHGVTPEKIESLRSATRAFFALPKEVKNQVRRTPDNYAGFFDSELTKNQTDWKEVFDFSGRHTDPESLVPEKLRSGTNLWLPDETLPEFRRTVQEHFDTGEQIARRLLKVFAVALSKDPEFFDQFFYHGEDETRPSNSSWTRLNYYPIAPEPEKTMGIHRHTDGTVLTVLLQDDDVATLQVYHREQNKWVFVPPIKDTFVINIGDTTQVWSNDKFIAPSHRVLANSKADRYSVPFFYQPLVDVDIAPIVVNEEEKPVYRPHNFLDYLRQRSTGNYGEEHLSHFRINYEESP